MARTSRDNMKNSSFFHIMVQGINQEYIFNTKKNKEEYLKLFDRNCEDIYIIAYCIMDNHAHILVKTDNIQDIKIWMKKCNTSYAIYYNQVNSRVGYVFRNRYKAQPIKNQKHLYLCAEYIHNNPVKAGMCKHKEEYPFSSYTNIYQGNQREVQKAIHKLEIQCMMQEKEEEAETEFELLENERENKTEKCEKIINDFLQEKELTIQELKNEKQDLKQIVEILKYQNNISYRIMEKYLKISREKLRKLTQI